MKIRIGSVLKTRDDLLVTNKDSKTSTKQRLIAVTSLDEETGNLTALKIYTHNGEGDATGVEVESEAGFKKKSFLGRHIITHEYVEKNNIIESKRMNYNNGNLKPTEKKIREETVEKAIKILSKRESRKLKRNAR